MHWHLYDLVCMLSLQDLSTMRAWVYKYLPDKADKEGCRQGGGTPHFLWFILSNHNPVHCTLTEE